MSDEYDVYIEQAGFLLDLEIETGPAGPAGATGPAGSNASATTDASLLISGTLSDARLSSNVALENLANVFSAKQSFSGVNHAGLCLNSLTTAEYNALTAANGDLFRDSTADRIDARLARGTVELIDSAGGQVVAGNLAATTLMVGGASGPLLRNNGGTIGARTNNNGADAPFACSNLTASGTVTAVNATGTGSLNDYSFISGNSGSATGDTWRFGKGWSGNYDTQFILAYADNAAKVTIDTSGAITAFGGYYVNVPASSSSNIRPLQHGNSFLRFSAPASGIPGNNTTVEGWDSVFINASTGNVRLRIGGSDRLVLSNTDLTLTGNLTASGTVRLGTYTVGTLPSAAANTRARAFVTDSSLAFNSTNLGATVTAGGAILVPVLSNGTNWVIG
jgi:hypothetical protein